MVPEGITHIDEGMFGHCSNLTRVTIPSSVTSIGQSAFDGCGELSTFAVAEENPNYKSVSGLLLTKDGKKLIHGVNGDVTIPDGVECIEKRAFFCRGGLRSVEIPTSVIRVESQAFFKTALKSVYVSTGDADRVKKLFLDSKHDIKDIRFIESKTDGS